MRLVFPLNHIHPVAPMELSGLLGGKGANLAEMTTRLDLPVPPGFTITTEACREYLDHGWPGGLDTEIAEALRGLEADLGRRLGDADDPLLVSVRSGATTSMPGMLDTVLNLGLAPRSVEGLASSTGDRRFAYESYLRFMMMFAESALGVPAEACRVEAEAGLRTELGLDRTSEIPVDDLPELAQRLRASIDEHSGEVFPDDPHVQLRSAVEAVFRSWHSDRAQAYRRHEDIPDDLGTAVTVQAMVFGNRDANSGTGVGFTRDPATGAAEPYGDYLRSAQGEDVVSGSRATGDLDDLANAFPAVHVELLDVFRRLEAHYRDMCDVEFTIERGRLWILQTRIGKRSGAAALRMAYEMAGEASAEQGWCITREEAVARILPAHVDQVLHPRLTERGEVIATGRAASPGAGTGRLVLSAEAAVEAKIRGERVVMVRTETSPDDVEGMLAAEAVVTSRGGLVSHAAVVARGWGLPAVVGADGIRVEEGQILAGGRVVPEGAYLSVDGSTGEVMLGDLELADADPPPELATVLGWADDIRRDRIGVRANADTAADARLARRLGAEGIGLCRTEHMFLGEGRIEAMRRMILAKDKSSEQAALAELLVAQREDFRDILRAMDGWPVTIRLLDPPLHEFLPSVEDLQGKEAAGGLTADEEELVAAVRHWSEVNPMLGTRGVRLGVLKPGLYSMQVEALIGAMADLAEEGITSSAEIMIPLTIAKTEVALGRTWVEGVLDAQPASKDLSVTVGTMVETPRAALLAGELAEVADFFSFGTNDLTQLCFGFSRDDVEARLIPAYLRAGLLEDNPFATLDIEGVGALVELATQRGRAASPTLKIGVCGEHGGDPASIAYFLATGADYVSCSPFRVPVARLATAQAVLAESAGNAHLDP